MAFLHLSKEEAVKDIAALIDQVSHGAEILIDSPDNAPILLRRAEPDETPDPAYDRWFHARVEEARSSMRPHHSLEAMYAAGQRLLAQLPQTGLPASPRAR